MKFILNIFVILIFITYIIFFISCEKEPWKFLETLDKQEEVKVEQEKRFYICEKCDSSAGRNHICEKTTYCYLCKRDGGKDHICGKTQFCQKCYKDSRFRT